MRWFLSLAVALALTALVGVVTAFAQSQPLSQTQFRDAVADRIATLQPEARIAIRDQLGLSVTIANGETWQVNLDNGYAEYTATTDQLSAIVDRWAHFVIRPERTRDPAAVVVVLRSYPVIQAYQDFRSQNGGSGVVLSRPFKGDLHEALVFDSPQSLEYASVESLREAGLTIEEAWALAPNNVPARMGAVEVGETTLAGILIVGGGNGLAPSLLVDPSICTRVPYADALIFVSARDTFFVGSGTQEAEANFRGFARFLIERGESMSRVLLQCRAGRLETVG